MRIYLNTRLIRRNNFLGKALLFSGLGVLAVGFLVSLSTPQEIAPFLLVAVVGMMFSQVGTLLMSRWSRSPRVDEVLDRALKGLDDRHALFHHFLGADHVLFSPTGVFVLVPVHEAGAIALEEGKWIRRTPRRGLFRPAKVEVLSEAQRSAKHALDRLTSRLEKLREDGAAPSARSVLVFVNPGAELRPSEKQPDAVHVKKLKEWLRRQTRQATWPQTKVEELGERLAR